MINRVLIRIKVVQMLYSYLLVENRFVLESQPLQPTKEKRYAYSLYLDTLALMMDIATQVNQRGKSPLELTTFYQRVSQDERIKALVGRRPLGSRMADSMEFPLGQISRQLAEEVKNSAVYKKYLKDPEGDLGANDRIWQEIFNLIIYPSTDYRRLASRMEGYTFSGLERMREMMEGTFTSFYSSADHLPDALHTLRRSMEKARELYLRLFMLPLELTRMRENDLEDASRKFLATDEDRNPNLRMVENGLVEIIAKDEALQESAKEYSINWTADDMPLLTALLKAILASDIYREYMEFPATDLEMDAEFWRNIFKHVILPNPLFLETLEDKSVFWNDDLDILSTFVLKAFKRIGEGKGKDLLLPMYKDEEDSEFGAQLFTYAAENREKYREMIDSALDKSIWEAERMAYMDVVVIMTALAEILNFPKVPLTVSINEYVEIAKSYSTRKSGQFVHGLLGDILDNLKETDPIVMAKIRNAKGK